MIGQDKASNHHYTHEPTSNREIQSSPIGAVIDSIRVTADYLFLTVQIKVCHTVSNTAQQYYN